MPSILPDGEPAPADGLLPPQASAGALDRGFSFYVHVPYCRVRCGYCDFNTYTATEFEGTNRQSYADEAIAEIRFAARVLRDSGLPHRRVQSVFFGGGTPTLLPARDLVRILSTIREEFGLEPGAEVTTEANPETLGEAGVHELAGGGFTRLSVGMQSAVPRVLEILDRTHSPAKVPQVLGWAADASLETSLDLIYGAPSETLREWDETLTEALTYETGHISAYALIVEQGTKLARQIQRGEVRSPSDDLQAEMYELAEQRLGGAGYEWYEISNWAKSAAQRSEHNLAYWRGDDWWGIGPGAHSHMGGVRWWNVKHPAAYAARIHEGISPAHAREILDPETRRIERVLLETRISAGLPTSVLHADERMRLAELAAQGLIDGRELIHGRVIPTLQGRLLADRVVNTILG